MAQQGFYSDPPNRRMAYDDDGSIVIYIGDGGSITQWNTSQAQALNNESSSTTTGGIYQGSTRYLCIIFPELRDVSHGYRNLATGVWNVNSYTTPWEVSSDTTNGIDGNWTNSNSSIALYESTSPNFRERLDTVGSSNTKGIRVILPSSGGFSNYDFRQWHLYGNKSAGQTPHRIDFCDSSGNDLLIDEDYGDQPRNSSRTWSPSNTWNQSSALYLKNRSTTKQAQDVNVTFEVLTGDMNNYLTVSKDNITFGTTVNYSTINPQQVVGPVYVKHEPTIAADLGVKTGRLQVAVGTWL